MDPFAKVSLLCGERRVKKKKKTAVRRATTNPVWNEAMSFNIPASLLASSAIEVHDSRCILKELHKQQMATRQVKYENN